MKDTRTDKVEGDILIIDDDPHILQFISDLLVEHGYEVRGALGGKAALTSIDKEPPDLILLDIMMPGIDGYEVCRQLKADKRHRDIPIIFLSGLQKADDKVMGFEVGAVDFITKPFQVGEVLARIDTHLTLSRLRKKLEQVIVKRTADLAKLKECEERYRIIIKTSPISIMAIRNGRVTFVNPAFAQMLGFSNPEEMVCLPALKIVAPESQQLVAERIKRLEAGKDNLLAEVVLLRQDGMRVTIESRSVFVPLNGIPTGLVIASDISDRKEKEKIIADVLTKFQEQILFDHLLATISNQFINLPLEQIDEGITKVLKQVAENIGIERIALLQFSQDKQCLTLTHTYALDQRQKAPLFIVSEELLWYTESLRQGKTLRISRIDDMPEEAVKEKLYAKEQGFNTFVTIPIKAAGSVIGAVSYSSMKSERDWPDEVVERLTLVTEFFANILARKDKEQNLQDAYNKIKQLTKRLENENLYLRQEIEVKCSHDEFGGKSKAIKQVLKHAEVVALQNTTVLILGETGTGKELVARAIHNMSRRKNRAMIKVNCAALPSALIESELFGREKGAYTGALTKEIGRFEAAESSTIFLDEIGDLPMDMQVKLLRVLQEHEYERLGSTKTIKADVRVIAATNQHLHDAVKEGKFRRDLFYRLNIFPITVPPLRDRREDIPQLLWLFVREFETAMGKKIERVSSDTINWMIEYSWPGNVRELKNVIERAMILNSTPLLHIDPAESKDAIDESMTLEDVARHHILKVLNNSGWRVGGKNGAAKILGLKRTTLQAKMKSLNIQRS